MYHHHAINMVKKNQNNNLQNPGRMGNKPIQIQVHTTSHSRIPTPNMDMVHMEGTCNMGIPVAMATNDHNDVDGTVTPYISADTPFGIRGIPF